MKFIAIIPARFASTRFPGKPLALLGGMTVIERVYKQVIGNVDEAIVATDNDDIAQEVNRFGGKAVMTRTDHKSGTDRCFEAYTKFGKQFDVIINVQGDEPFIQTEQILAIKQCFDDDDVKIATLVKPFTRNDGFKAIDNTNSPKVVLNDNMEAVYFSRAIIPFVRGVEPGEEWFDKANFYKHIGIYAYKPETLEKITQLKQSSLEIAESLEQLRWIQNGYRIKVGITNIETIAAIIIFSQIVLNNNCSFNHSIYRLIARIGKRAELRKNANAY